MVCTIADPDQDQRNNILGVENTILKGRIVFEHIDEQERNMVPRTYAGYEDAGVEEDG